MKEVFLIRHSEHGSCSVLYKFASDHVRNMQRPLSSEGISYANHIFSKPEYKVIEEIYSSNYLRAKQTAKILAKKLNIKVIIDKELRERKIGVNRKEKYPVSFEKKQMENQDYKLTHGESINEVKKRTYDALMNILSQTDKTHLAIISHGTAILSLLMNWCDIEYNGEFKFNNQKFYFGELNYCSTFKLTFDDQNKLTNIENIK